MDNFDLDQLVNNNNNSDFRGLEGSDATSSLDYDADYMQQESFNQKEIYSEVNDAAPAMSDDFYQSLDNFLSQGAPKLKDGTGATKKKKNKSSSQKASFLPNIAETKGAIGLATASPPLPPQMPSKGRSKIAVKSTSARVSGPRQVDQKLLQEAFQYTDFLLREALLEESGGGKESINEEDGRNAEQGSQQGNKSRKGNTSNGNNANKGYSLQSRTSSIQTVYRTVAPCGSNAGSMNNQNVGGGKKKVMSAGNGMNKQRSAAGTGRGAAVGGAGAVSKLRAKIASGPAGTGGGGMGISSKNNFGRYADEGAAGSFSTAMDSNSSKSSSNAMTFDELVSNFEGGVELQRLRKELELSKQSMKKSEDFMKQLSGDYLGAR
mmetsp:Transcript_24565/g.40947  ORF Transcript_24565/g.40947 Transcript_24565/m.40947 type:complete len:378 (+) Transcript_24565:115-1248(+)|eukprot:CAMPEP_0174975360 /NCGR_PEP_ID=MMETSP0004_2-20121128/12396_1 /TAXON_ID=420556 /ORGANISM="Ochromonas sp., Strain CCMP1393" /LENGTH=377 /DNA_ID=CAMNT_0016226195 /DNA_START=102 /DNA_END=1235 /DNA_ORIENTATION=+